MVTGLQDPVLWGPEPDATLREWTSRQPGRPLGVSRVLVMASLLRAEQLTRQRYAPTFQGSWVLSEHLGEHSSLRLAVSEEASWEKQELSWGLNTNTTRVRVGGSGAAGGELRGGGALRQLSIL